MNSILLNAETSKSATNAISEEMIQTYLEAHSLDNLLVENGKVPTRRDAIKALEARYEQYTPAHKKLLMGIEHKPSQKDLKSERASLKHDLVWKLGRNRLTFGDSDPEGEAQDLITDKFVRANWIETQRDGYADPETWADEDEKGDPAFDPTWPLAPFFTSDGEYTGDVPALQVGKSITERWGLTPALSELPRAYTPLKGKHLEYARGTVVLLYGRKGSGKSGVGIFDAIENALTEKVIYISTEENQDAVKAKVRAYVTKHPETELALCENLIVFDRWHWESMPQTMGRRFDIATMPEGEGDATIELLGNLVAEFKPIALYIDVLAGAYVGLENDNATATNVMSNLSWLADNGTHQTAVILVHHTGKDEKAGARGAQAWQDKAATIIKVSFNKLSGIVSAVHEFQRYTMPGLKIRFSRHTASVEHVGNVFLDMPYLEPIEEKISLYETIRDLMYDLDESSDDEVTIVTTGEIKEATQAPDKAVNDALTKLVEDKVIVKVRRGEYQLTATLK